MAQSRSMESRVGRTNQRYNEEGTRLVAGVVPLNPSRTQVLLIQSTHRATPEWVLPKGGWETDETCPEAALREAWEEGGIVCRIDRDLGRIIENKREKNGSKPNGEPRPADSLGKEGKGCLFQFYEVTVLEEKEEWPERHKRARKWFGFEEAREKLNGRLELREALERSSLGMSIGRSVKTTQR